jgi:hypothetical protein
MSITNTALSTGAAANVYTSSGNSVVSTLHICNFSATAQTVNVYIVPSGTEANSTNIIYSNVSIASYNTYVVDKEKFILANSDSIRANANSASTVSVSVTYTGM